MGTLMLIDESSGSSGDMEEFTDVQGCRLMKFPISSENSKVSLYTLKMLKFHQLL